MVLGELSKEIKSCRRQPEDPPEMAFTHPHQPWDGSSTPKTGVVPRCVDPASLGGDARELLLQSSIIEGRLHDVTTLVVKACCE